MRRIEIATALALLIVSAVVMTEAIRLGVGWGEVGPQSGFFIFWLAVTLAGSNLWILARAVRAAPGPGAGPLLPPGSVPRLLTVFLPMIGAFLFIELVGFYLASLVYLLVYIRLTGRHSWRLTLTVCVLFPLFAFLIFRQWFLMPLPKGLLGDWLLPF